MHTYMYELIMINIVSVRTPLGTKPLRIGILLSPMPYSLINIMTDGHTLYSTCTITDILIQPCVYNTVNIIRIILAFEQSEKQNLIKRMPEKY